MLKPVTFGALLCSLLVAPAFAAEEEPAWLREARAREGNVGELQKVTSKDGIFSVKTPGKSTGDIELADGAYFIPLDIGAPSPVFCEVTVDGFDLAAILPATADVSFTAIESNQGKIEQRAIERTDAGAFGSSPFMGVDWVYRVNDGGAPKLGALKQIAALKQGYGIYCAHNELGYAKTFVAAVKSLIESLEFTQVVAQPTYIEISTASIGGARVGVVLTTIEPDTDGDRKLQVMMSLALRLAADKLSTQDNFQIQWVRSDETLINARDVVAANGELETNLSLEELEEGGWRVQGSYKGKTLDQKIESQGVPQTWTAQAKERRSQLSQKDIVGKQLTSLQWTGADPTRFVESQSTVLSILDGDRVAVKESVGSLVAEAVVEKSTGMPSRMSIPMGPANMEIERVYQHGSL